MSSAVVISTSVGLSGGAVLALFAIGVVGVVIVESTKKSPEEKYRENFANIKKTFDLMLDKIKKRENYIQKKHSVELDNSKNYEKFARGIIVNFKIGSDFASNMNRLKEESDKHLYEIKEIENEDIREIEYELGNITNKIKNLKDEKKLESDLERINSLKNSSNKLMKLDDKKTLVATIKSEIDRYSYNLDVIDKTKELQNYISGSSFANLKEERVEILSTKEKLIKKIVEFKEKVKKYSENYNRFEDISRYSEEKLKLIYSSVKLDYGKAKDSYIMTRIYKEDLAELRELIVDKTVLSKIDNMRGQNSIKRDEYRSMANEISELIIAHEKKMTIINSLKENLTKLGYEIVEENNEMVEKLENGEVVYLDTKEADYKVMLKVEDEQIRTRFVRVVAKQSQKSNISQYQKQKDTERAKEWCSSHDKLTALLEENGILLEEKLRIEPEESDILYVVDEKMVKRSEERSVKSQNLKEKRV